MLNYDNVVAIDEATKKFMNYMNEDISEAINDGIKEALRNTNRDIDEIQDKINTIMLDEKRNTKLIEDIHACDILSKLNLMEEKLIRINEKIEGQAVLLDYVQNLGTDIKYLKLPFYKRWFHKEAKV